MKYIWWCLLLLSPAAFPQQNGDEKEIDYSNVIGDPYLNKDWADGVIRFNNGRTMTQFKLKFDCLRNQLVLQFQGSSFGAQNQVREFVMYLNPKKKADSVLFRKGYPAIDKLTENTYYEVLHEGKTTLLRLYAKDLIQEKELITSNRAGMRMQDKELFYLYQDGAMKELPADKSELAKLVPGKEAALTQFINQQDLKFRTAEDYMKLVKKLETLL